jgi:hypothetical protein
MSFEELRERGYKRWYEFGLRAPRILWARAVKSKAYRFRLRMAWQRARRGYAHDQLWNLNFTIATLMVAGCRMLRENKNGYPSEFSEEPYGDGSGWEHWESILAQIEEGYQAWLDYDGLFLDWKQEGHDKADEAKAKFRAAQDLSMIWFNSLWD